MQPSAMPSSMDEELWRAHKRRSAGPNLWRGPDGANNNNAPQQITQEHTSTRVSYDMQCWSRGGVPCTCGSCRSPNAAMIKKGTATTSRSDVMKRFRAQQQAYELSPDLLEKQVEMLERKYGGAKARRAALVIQRAFRRYKLVRKFAAITAMAKAEKRLSRRLEGTPGEWSPSHHFYQLGAPQRPVFQAPPDQHPPCDQCASEAEVVIRNNFAALYRDLSDPKPAAAGHSNRPQSMRDRRGNSVPSPRQDEMTPKQQQSLPPHIHPAQLPRSHSEAEDGPSYSQFEEYCAYYCSHQQFSEPVVLTTATHYYAKEETEVRRMATPTTIITAPRPVSNKSTTSTPRLHTSTTSATSGGSPVPASQDWGPPHCKKVPPEVPKRTTSILSQRANSSSPSPSINSSRNNNSSLLNGSSVMSSSMESSNLSISDSSISLSTERSESEVWTRKTQMCLLQSPELSAVSAAAREETPTLQAQHVQLRALNESQVSLFKVPETVRKRQYRVGLNLFNKKPERGINHLIRRGFLENSPQGVARFLITRKGLSKQMIGEYLGTLQNPFNMAVLECFAQEMDLSAMTVDVALRKFQTHFRMPGEAQKIERLMEVFGQRYCHCNDEAVSRLRSPDTVFVLAFAVIMLNTDLHTPNLKPERRMKLEDFVKNLRGIDDGADIERDLLVGIYERVKNSEFKPGHDHVTQVMKVQSTIGGKKPNLALPHRRLVCYCRLYEVPDIYKKERPGLHQREVFLFNDLLVITKIFSKKKSSVTYSFRESFTLCGMMVSTFETPHYQFGIRLSQRMDNRVLVMFNARNEHDRCKFAEDLRESICEMDEMENLRIEAELERQKSGRRRAVAENRDSGVADVEVALSPTVATPHPNAMPQACPVPAPGDSSPADTTCGLGGQQDGLKRSALSNSLLDIHDQFNGEKPQRRGSVGSLDSGMSVSFQSTSASTLSRDSSPQNMQPATQPQQYQQRPPQKSAPHLSSQQQQSFLGGIFHKRRPTRPEDNFCAAGCRSTEV
ncbi:IQ motif and SEC7 domain-containing protein 2 [Neocloeon triangulifer]|uniref:IQ motif and SEC7 domain-containing protein 2 n=1 Tax=Neocloeon triangulifer TaxID=2078957 RepID=UPI00286EEBA9|nr:IQ motif and SEC7 domain-containing protein 2 [Neocloeon triangulifer]